MQKDSIRQGNSFWCKNAPRAGFVPLKCWWTPNRLCKIEQKRLKNESSISSTSNENVDPSLLKIVSMLMTSISWELLVVVVGKSSTFLLWCSTLLLSLVMPLWVGKKCACVVYVIWGCVAATSAASCRLLLRASLLCSSPWKRSQDWNCTVKFRFAGLWKPFVPPPAAFSLAS